MLILVTMKDGLPLHVAAMFNQPAILKALLASHMIKYKSNNTAIDYRGTC